MPLYTVLLVTLASGAPSGCREGLAPFAPETEEPDTSAVRRLTFNPGEDVDPVFLSNDSVMYAAESFPGIPGGRGLLVVTSIHGGAARLLLADVQGQTALGPRWLAQPARSPFLDRLAFIEVASIATPLTVTGAEPCPVREPLLDSLVLRILTTPSAGPLSPTDPARAVRLEGRDPRQKAGLTGPWETGLHPFQATFLQDRKLPLHPSWSRDGVRIVFSDGLGLHLWNGNSAIAPVALAGTSDGVSPSWSPDGEWIAFTRLVRGEATRAACAVSAGNTTQTQNRTGWDITARRLELIRPDGNGTRTLGEGEDPAWSADSRTIFVRRAGAIWAVPLDGNAPTLVPGTEGGRQPAVAPDSRHLVFVRPGSNPDTHDVWVVRLAR